jgi:LEA14-like dessication related protein
MAKRHSWIIGGVLIGGAAVLYYMNKVDGIVSKIAYNFKQFSIKKEDLSLLQITFQTVFNLKSSNTFPIEIIAYEGFLYYGDDKIGTMRFDTPVTMLPNQAVDLTYNTTVRTAKTAGNLDDILHSGNLFRTFRSKGDLVVRMEGVTYRLPVNEVLRLAS